MNKINVCDGSCFEIYINKIKVLVGDMVFISSNLTSSGTNFVLHRLCSVIFLKNFCQTTFISDLTGELEVRPGVPEVPFIL